MKEQGTAEKFLEKKQNDLRTKWGVVKISNFGLNSFGSFSNKLIWKLSEVQSMFSNRLS